MIKASSKLVVQPLVRHLVGRRRLLLVGAAVMTAALSTMAVAFSQAQIIDGEPLLSGVWGPVALVAANLFVVGFGMSWGPIVWVLLGEMFPNRIRALALGIGGAAQWAANFVVSSTFPILADIGLQLTYGLYGLFALLAFFFVYRFVPEAKGRQLESMEELMDAKPTAAGRSQSPASTAEVSPVGSAGLLHLVQR